MLEKETILREKVKPYTDDEEYGNLTPKDIDDVVDYVDKLASYSERLISGVALFHNIKAYDKDNEQEVKEMFMVRDLLLDKAYQKKNSKENFVNLSPVDLYEDELVSEEFLVKIWGAVKAWFLDLCNKIAAWFQPIVNVVKTIFNMILDVGKGILTFLKEVLTPLLDALLGGHANTVFEALNKILSGLWTIINSLIGFVDLLVNVLTTISNFVKNMVESAGDYLNMQYAVSITVAFLSIVAYAVVIPTIYYMYSSDPFLNSVYSMNNTFVTQSAFISARLKLVTPHIATIIKEHLVTIDYPGMDEIDRKRELLKLTHIVGLWIESQQIFDAGTTLHEKYEPIVYNIVENYVNTLYFIY